MPLAKREQLKRAQHVVLPSRKSPTSSSLAIYPSPDTSFVIGVGAGALYMLISCHEEMKRLNKTVEQTQYLLQELKKQNHHHCGASLSLSCTGSQSVPSAGVPTALSQGSDASMDQTGHLPFASRICNRDSLLEEQVSATQGMAKDQMAALAAELEAELELMELNINAEDILLDQSSKHDAGEVSSRGLLNSYHSDTSSLGMVEASNSRRPPSHIEPSQSEYGVSAVELDHRLREVLEAQQQERILELEKLLKETEAKLLAKEDEILGWKNHVNSLSNLFQHASVCGMHIHRCVNGNGAESVASYDNLVANVPEVKKNTLELLHSCQNPPISIQVKDGECTSSPDLPANVSKKETNMRSLSAHVFSDDGSSLNKASYSLTPSLKGSLVTDSNCYLDGRQGTAFDTPVFVILEELDAQAIAQKSESLRGQAVSKAFEVSDIVLPDEWSNDRRSSWHRCDGHSESSRVHVDEENTASSGIKIVSSSLHHMTSKFDMMGTSVSSFDFGRTNELEKDSSDVKHIVNSFKAKSTSDNGISGKEGMQAPKRDLKLKRESTQILSKGLGGSTFLERSVEVKSPVLDKIRHYESLVRHARGK